MNKTHSTYSGRVLKALERIHKKLPRKTDPLIRGCLVTMIRVCGRSNCRCAKGYKHRSLYLSQSVKGKLKMIYIPKGCAHGFLTLEDNTEFAYKVSDYYSPKDEQGIAWNDASLAIAWPKMSRKYILSEKDRKNPPLEIH